MKSHNDQNQTITPGFAEYKQYNREANGFGKDGEKLAELANGAKPELLKRGKEALKGDSA